MRTRQKELEAIEELLSSPAESVEALAKEVWNLLDHLRRGRDLWVLGMRYTHFGQFLFGPYESEAMAIKDLEGRGKIRGLDLSDAGRVFKLYSPTDNFFVTEKLPEQGIMDYR